MRRAILLTLAAGSLLVLSACGSGATTTAAGPSPSVLVTVPAAPASTEPAPTPELKKRTITRKRSIPFKTMRVNDPTLAKGTTAVRTHGVRGIRLVTYRVTLTDGIETDRKLVRKLVSRAPVSKVIAVGTKETQHCDPNYSGACVPIAPDVDCAGGSGNGPAYVQGPVEVVGSDIYGLDADGDGVGCDDG